MTNLTSIVFTLQHTIHEKARGFAQISGNYDYPGDPTTITLQMSSTPEPSSLSLFGSGLFALAALRRRWR